MYDRDVLLLTTAQWFMYTDRFQDSPTLPIYKRTKALSLSTQCHKRIKQMWPNMFKRVSHF